MDKQLIQICFGLLSFIREVRPEKYFFKDPQFVGLQTTLDNEMKRLRSQGVHVGVKRKRAESISIEEEEILWEKGLLGEDSPKVLLDTMIYLHVCGVHFTLRRGQEHRSLQRNQLELVKPETDLSYLIYTENISKNNSGGLSHRKRGCGSLFGR